MKKVIEVSPSTEFDDQMNQLNSFIQAVPTVHTAEEIKKDRDLTLQRQKNEKEKKEKEVEKRRSKANEKRKELEDAIRQAEEMEMAEKAEKDKGGDKEEDK